MDEKRAWGETAASDLVGRGPRIWLLVVLGVLTLLFAALVVRLFWIQVVQHDELAEAARRMHRGTDTIPAYRGDIRDVEGVILARSRECREVGIDPSKVGRDVLVRIVQRVSDELALSTETRRERLAVALDRQRRGLQYVRIARGVELATAEGLPEDLAGELPEGALSALCLRRVSRRVWPRTSLAAAVVGVTDAYEHGVEGIERALDSYLREQPGRRRVLRDALQTNRYCFPETDDVPPIDGYDVYLTLDVRAQRILAEELEDALAYNEAEAGVGVMLDCRDGAVLAMVSLPSFEPEHFHDYPREERRRRRANGVTEKSYEPGSVMKPFVAAAAFALGLARRDEVLWDGGISRKITIGRHSRCVKDVHDHSPLTAEDAVVYSSNVGMSFLGLRLGRDRLRPALLAFGFGRTTGIRLPGEAPGKVQDLDKWTELYTSVSVSFGHELMVTPLQLANAFASLVNGGTLWRPRVVDRLVRGEETLINPPEVLAHPIDAETSRQMRDILHRVVQEGTGKWLRMEGFEFGGKTGTADMAGPGGYHKKDYLASFEAFAPYDDPQVVVLIMVEKPRRGSIYGSMVAGPAVAGALRRWFRVEAEPRIAKYLDRKPR